MSAYALPGRPEARGPAVCDSRGTSGSAGWELASRRFTSNLVRACPSTSQRRTRSREADPDSEAFRRARRWPLTPDSQQGVPEAELRGRRRSRAAHCALPKPPQWAGIRQGRVIPGAPASIGGHSPLGHPSSTSGSACRCDERQASLGTDSNRSRAASRRAGARRIGHRSVVGGIGSPKGRSAPCSASGRSARSESAGRRGSVQIAGEGARDGSRRASSAGPTARERSGALRPARSDPRYVGGHVESVDPGTPTLAVDFTPLGETTLRWARLPRGGHRPRTGWRHVARDRANACIRAAREDRRHLSRLA
ncbi:hypothetical protein AVP42_01417 [Agromyces sp. NDB4Y10]|nr:hypothetical protein AVP42_01417 [Agromyces sp. NDB4Y10]